MAKKLAKALRAPARGARATKIARRGRATKIGRRECVGAEPKAKPHANSPTKRLPSSLARPHGNRLVFAPELIADGKRRYETTTESLDSIAIDFGSNRSTLRNIAKREGWVRYVAPPRGLPRAADIAAKAEALEAEALEVEALSSPPPERGRSPSETRRVGVSSAQQESRSLTLPLIASRTASIRSPMGGENGAWSVRERIDALRNAVDEEIAAVRALRAKLKTVPHSTETAGRTSRTLADLTTTLERLHRLEIGASQHNGQDAHANNHADKFSDIPADLDAFRDELARRIRAFVASRVGARNADGDSGPAGVDEVR